MGARKRADANNRPQAPLDFVVGVPRTSRTPAEMDAAIAEDARIQRERIVLGLLDASGLPVEHAEADALDVRILPDAAREGLLHAGRELVKWTGGQSIVGLIGPRGTGKSTVTAAHVLRWCHAGKGARYVLARNYARMCSEGRSFSSTLKESEVERRYASPQLLVIDELHLLAATDQDDVAIRALVQLRWDLRKPTVLVSNETPDAFKQRLGASLVDRMRHRGTTVVCDWKSLRGPQAGEAAAR